MTLACSIGSGRVVARRFAGSLRRLITSDDRREHDLALAAHPVLDGDCSASGADAADRSSVLPGAEHA
jgi:hypothetical protein